MAIDKIKITGDFLKASSCKITIITEDGTAQPILSITDCTIRYDRDMGWVATLTVPIEVDLEAHILSLSEEPMSNEEISKQLGDKLADILKKED